MLPVEIRKEENIAIIAPHPDDEVIGAGGLLSAYPSQCTVILMTDGRHGDSNIEPETLKVRRHAEFSAVMGKLGAKSICLDYEDGTLLGRTIWLPACMQRTGFGNKNFQMWKYINMRFIYHYMQPVIILIYQV